MCDSLPQALLQQAQSRPEQTALRYKQFGIWQKRSWGELAIDVRSLAAALKGVGFGPADRLFIISEARAEALLLTLAAHWLGAASACSTRRWITAHGWQASPRSLQWSTGWKRFSRCASPHRASSCCWTSAA
ncbi:Uncharacterized protein AC516_2552 [Pseudomonas amygdali pv. sesami]|nr:Uncharacterized protein AC516_2552 [Pseudomonas amygdali pv. sesami]